MNDGYAFYAAQELNEAVVNDLLTAAEARLIYWSQFPALRQQAATTPPAIGDTND